jgi:hypothetical protein
VLADAAEDAQLRLRVLDAERPHSVFVEKSHASIRTRVRTARVLLRAEARRPQRQRTRRFGMASSASC